MVDGMLMLEVLVFVIYVVVVGGILGMMSVLELGRLGDGRMV